MRAEDYMLQYRRCRVEIERCRERIQILSDNCQRVTSSWQEDKVQSSHLPDKLGELIARISDLEEDLMIQVSEAIDLMNQIEGVINLIPDPDYQRVLHKRYIACKTYEQIANDMIISERWAWELNQRALREVDKLINGYQPAELNIISDNEVNN